MNVFKKMIAILAITIATTANAQTNVIKHTVERGETLTVIAERYGTTVEKIKELNPDTKQFIYVGMEIKVPANIKSSEIQTIPKTNILSKSQSIDDSDKYINTNENRIDESPGGFCGIMVHSYMENEAYKYGANVEIEGAVIIKYGWGVGFSTGWDVLWKPKFDLANCKFSLGPLYATKVSPTVDFYIPVKLLSVWDIDENDKWHSKWGCRINPTFLIGKNQTKLAAGAFVDILDATGWGLTLGITF